MTKATGTKSARKRASGRGSRSASRRATRSGRRTRASKKAIVVLGAHRSGTSAITRVLSLSGAALPSDLIPPVPDNNETGFWEPRDIVDIHDEILASAGSYWHDVSRFPSSWFASDLARQFRERILAVLQEDFGDSPLFVIKDPRLCRLVPLWLSILDDFGADPLFVLLVRNPLEVAASLKARDGFSAAKSMLLWLQHFLAAERDTRQTARSFVSYSALLHDWRATVDGVASDLDFVWPRRSHKVAAEIDDFLSLQHRHHAYPEDVVATRPDIVDWIKRAYDWALQATRGEHAAPELLDAISSELEAAELAFAPALLDVEEKLSRVEKKLSVRESEIESSLRRATARSAGCRARLAIFEHGCSRGTARLGPFTTLRPGA
jgi:hypothetical protein